MAMRMSPLNRGMLKAGRAPASKRRVTRVFDATVVAYPSRVCPDVLQGEFFVTRQLGALNSLPRVEALRDARGARVAFGSAEEARRAALGLNAKVAC